MKRSLVLLAATTALLTASPAWAGPTIYSLNQTVGAGNVSGSITTDGTTGALGSGNITAFNLLLNDGTTTFNLTNLNGGVLFSGNALTATAGALSFNFGAAGTNFALFQAPNPGSGVTYFCLQTSGCYQPVATPGEGLRITGTLLNNSLQGNVSFATAAVAGVPEPATWAMMLAGFGAMGFAMRRRKKVATRIRFA